MRPSVSPPDYVRDPRSGLYIPHGAVLEKDSIPREKPIAGNPLRVSVVTDRLSTISSIGTLVISALTAILLAFTLYYAKKQWVEANKSAEAAQVAASAAASNADTAERTLSEIRNGGTATDTHTLAQQAVRQSRQTATLANAAQSQAVTSSRTEQDTLATERAFIFPDIALTYDTDPQGNVVRALRATLSWKNSGATPTTGMSSFIKTSSLTYASEDFEKQYRRTILSPPRQVAAFVPPGSTVAIEQSTISAPDLDAISEGRIQEFIYGIATYRDVFQGTAEHMTRFCYRVVSHNKRFEVFPRLSDANFTLVNCARHNCYDTDCDKDR